MITKLPSLLFQHSDGAGDDLPSFDLQNSMDMATDEIDQPFLYVQEAEICVNIEQTQAGPTPVEVRQVGWT